MNKKLCSYICGSFRQLVHALHGKTWMMLFSAAKMQWLYASLSPFFLILWLFCSNAAVPLLSL